MPQISAAEIAFGLLGWLAALVMLGIVVVWYVVLWRLTTGRGLPELERLVNVGRVDWGIGTIILALGLYIAVNLGTQWGYLRFTGRLPSKPRAAAPTRRPSRRLPISH